MKNIHNPLNTKNMKNMLCVLFAFNTILPGQNRKVNAMQKYLLLLLTIIFVAVPVFADFEIDVSGTGTTAASFLEIGVGARAMSMGGAYTSIIDGPTALYYNPANIVWLQGIQVEFMHNEWLVYTKHDFLGAVIPLSFMNSALGLGFISLDYGEQEVRTEYRPEGTGEMYGARDFCASITLATVLTDRFSFGLTGKYINETIWNTSSNGFAVDMGVFYRTPLDGLNIGMSIVNFGGETKLSGRDLDTTVDPDEEYETIDNVPAEYSTDSFPLPITFRAGISYGMELGKLGSVLATIDVNHPTNNTESVNLGMEYGFMDMFFLRCGYENLGEDDAENGLTLGAGMDFYYQNRYGFRIDYAYSDWGILESSSRFSLGLIF